MLNAPNKQRMRDYIVLAVKDQLANRWRMWIGFHICIVKEPFRLMDSASTPVLERRVPVTWRTFLQEMEWIWSGRKQRPPNRPRQSRTKANNQKSFKDPSSNEG